jgi:hypothetical protein
LRTRPEEQATKRPPNLYRALNEGGKCSRPGCFRPERGPEQRGSSRKRRLRRSAVQPGTAMPDHHPRYYPAQGVTFFLQVEKRRIDGEGPKLWPGRGAATGFVTAIVTAAARDPTRSTGTPPVRPGYGAYLHELLAHRRGGQALVSPAHRHGRRAWRRQPAAPPSPPTRGHGTVVPYTVPRLLSTAFSTAWGDNLRGRWRKGPRGGG